jgi:hypothetical protein
VSTSIPDPAQISDEISCTNLFADESYCVAPVGDLNTYSGRPGFTSAVITAITGTQVYSTLPTATYKPIPFNNTRVLADGTRDDCVSYFDGSKFPSLESLNVTTYNSVCDFVAEMFLVTALDLQFWNPGRLYIPIIMIPLTVTRTG